MAAKLAGKIAVVTVGTTDRLRGQAARVFVTKRRQAELDNAAAAIVANAGQISALHLSRLSGRVTRESRNARPTHHGDDR